MNESRPIAAAAVVVGSSAGGVGALLTLVPELPAHTPQAVLIAQHLSARDPGLLPRLLGSHARLPVEEAVDASPIRAGVVYVARPWFDLVVAADRTLSLVRPARAHPIPSVDRLFETAAAVYRERLLAVVLTGCGTDGARGAVAVKRAGGRVIAQDPATAAAPWMPRAAIRSGAVDLVLPLAEIAPAVAAPAAPSVGAPPFPRRAPDVQRPAPERASVHGDHRTTRQLPHAEP